jgi:alpha-tubulin suppressor-like RCC1 family protein
MSLRYKGGIISSVAPTTSGTPYTGAAPGIWSKDDQMQAKAAGLWPKGVGVPDAPTSIVATAGTTQASVTFTAPADNGGSAITEYTATSSPGGISASGASSPITVTGLTDGTQYTFTVVATNDRGNSAPSAVSNAVTPANTEFKLFTWGSNIVGSGGLGNNTKYSSPKQVGSLTTWVTTSGMRTQGGGVDSAGRLWMWGQNFYGSLGLGNQTYYSSPKQVGALTNWASVNGAGSIVAIKTNGTIWGWGQNNHGQLGIGNTTNYSSPKQIGALTDWLSIRMTGNYHCTLAIRGVGTSGALWSWGSNFGGSCGLGNTTKYSSPKQVGALTNWEKLQTGSWNGSASAIKTDGTLWAWGYGTNGNLGLGNTTNYSSPKQVGLLTTWTHVSKSANATTAVADGKLYMWGGTNTFGQLGQGNLNQYSSPKQVGSLTTWLSGAADYNTAAIKTDGTLWTWGKNNNGQLGLGNTTYYSSPKQVGSLTKWNKVDLLLDGCIAQQSI